MDRPKKSKIDIAEKYVKAAKAGGEDFKKCTLILTEGDSAKALVVSGSNFHLIQANHLVTNNHYVSDGRAVCPDPE